MSLRETGLALRIVVLFVQSVTSCLQFREDVAVRVVHDLAVVGIDEGQKHLSNDCQDDAYVTVMCALLPAGGRYMYTMYV